MSDKIIQITEENLRKAVESGDLKQLAPEVFEKKKVKVQIRIKEWEREEIGCRVNVFPISVPAILSNDTKGVVDHWSDLIGKPPMLMTLEWEE